MRDSNRQHYNVANADAQGGTAMDRARGMGFDTEAYHGTNEPLVSVSNGLEGKGLYTSNNPRVANDFATWRRTYQGANVNPLLIKKGKNLEIDANYKPIRDVEINHTIPGMRYGETVDDYADRELFDSILFKNVRDDVPSAPNMTPVSDVLRNINPKNIRSRFAAFDPLRKNSADLLASYLLPATMLGYGMYNENKKGSLADWLGGR